MTDVVVIGAGPGGIAAATIAAERGQSVVVIDEAPRPGGQIWRHVSRHSLPRIAAQWLHRFDRSSVQILSGTTVIDVTRNADGFAISTSHGAMDARSIVIATGARERFLPFPGWTLPGVMGVGGAQALFKAGASMRDRRVIIAGSGPLLLPVASALARGGASVTHIIEQAPASRVARFAAGLVRTPSRIAQAAAYRAQSFGARYMTGAWVSAAQGTHSVRTATIATGSRSHTEACDILCVGYGLIPSTEIARLIGCATLNGALVVDIAQRTSVDRVYAVGESTGVAGVEAALLEGQIAAHAITGTDSPRSLVRAAAKERAFAKRMDAAFELRPELRQLATPETIVCRCEDVTLGAVTRCESMREAKLHTRAGMGPCQGRVCGPALELLFNWSESTVRPPVVPAPVSAFLSDTSAAAGGVT